jgi:integrase
VSQDIGKRPGIGALAPPSVSGRSENELRELFLRRGLAPRTVSMYVGIVVRAETFCRGVGISIDELSAEDLARFASTLPQSRTSLGNARAALGHYWSGIGRRSFPRLDLVEILGVPSKDPLEGLAAREMAREMTQAMQERSRVSEQPTWSEMGFDRDWLVTRLRARHLGPRTAYNYVRQLAHLAQWCIEHGATIDTVSGGLLEEYAEELPRSRSTRGSLRSALTHYFAMTLHPEPPLWAVRVPKARRMVCRALEDDDARTLEAAALARNDQKGLAVIIGLYLGLRRFEIAKLRWADFSDGWLHIVGKGDVEASIPVHQVVVDYLGRVPNRSVFLFPGRSSGSLNPTTLWGWVREVATEAGLGQVPTHVLRHTALATANDETGDLRSVQDFARHAEPTTTSGYTRTTRRRMVAVSEAIGGFYERPDDPEAEPFPARPGQPGLPLAELVALVEGAHAVDAWLDLADTLGQRPGWRLRGSGDGAGGIDYAFGAGKLSASAMTWTNGRAPTFTIQCEVGPTVEDIVWWDLPDVNSLGALLATFEAGGVPFPPTGESVVADDGQDAESEHV